MKGIKLVSVVLILLGFLVQYVSAQAPQGMNYQAIARDASGTLLPNKTISIRITITDGSGGTVLYKETHSATTNQFGLFTLNVGNGTPVTGTFSSITWSSKTPWMQVEMDPNGGNTYVNMGTSQLLSVPYALYSAAGGTTYTQGTGINITGTTISNTAPDQTVALNNGTGISVSGTYPNFTITNTSPDKTVVLSPGSGISVTGTYPNFTIASTATSPINGTQNYVVKFTGSSTGGNSQIYDDGTSVGVGTTTPNATFGVIQSNANVLGRFSNSNAAGYALYGVNSAVSGASNGAGVTGVTSQSMAGALQGVNSNTSGTGIVASGNGSTASYLTPGSGGAITGYTTGLFAKSLDPGTSESILTDNFGNIVALNYYDNANTIQYKIQGTGTVSTIVNDPANNRVVLHAPETPEIYFMDYGQGQLVNGFAHIDLDPTLAKNVAVNQKHPLRVFIQLEDNENCKGVVVKNKTVSGFDVLELNGGTSNTPFQYQLVCNRADEILPNGRISKNADARFESGIKPVNQSTLNIEATTK